MFSRLMPSSAAPGLCMRIISLLSPLLIAQGELHAQSPQSMPILERGQSADWRLRWPGVPWRSYFIQTSTDLIHWSYLDTVAIGDGSEQFFEFNANGGQNRLFLRLRYSPTHFGIDPAFDDIDGDGLPDLFEVRHGFDPFLIDTDGNGTSDGNEDTDGDGWTNAQEIDGTSHLDNAS